MSADTPDSNTDLNQTSTQSIKKPSPSSNGNKRPFKQFSVKTQSNTATSFKTNFNKNSHKHNSSNSLTDYCNSYNHSPKSLNSTTSSSKSRSYEDISKSKRNNSKSMLNAKINNRQLSKTLSRNSIQSKTSKQSSPNLTGDNTSKENSTTIKPNMATGLNKTFDLHSDSDYEDLEEENIVGINKLETQVIEANTEDKDDTTDVVNNTALSSQSTRNTILDGSEATSGSLEYKNIIKSSSKLLAIDKDSLFHDPNKLSYLVPSSFRTNSRVSADRISANALLKAGSQNYTDLISSGLMEDALDDANDKIDLSEKEQKESFNKEDNGFAIYNPEVHAKPESGDFIDNSNLNTNIMEEENYLTSSQPQLNKVHSQENMANLGAEKDTKFSTDSLKLKNDNANEMEYSSFSSSFMHDKNSDHKFNYINKDFINSSTSTEISQYFSTNDRSTIENPSEISDNSQVSSRNATIKDEFGAPNNNEVPLIATNKRDKSSSTLNLLSEQNRLSKLKQASLDQKLSQTSKVQTRNTSMTNLYTNLSNNRSPITTPDRNVMKNNLFSGRNLSNLETSNARPNSSPSLQRNPANNPLNSNSMAANSLLKIATMANSNGSPVAQKQSDMEFNDFNSFLKSDSLKKDKDSRTQQRLWLQRENSILDLSTDQSRSKFDAIFQPFSVDAKRDFENITKEYNNIKRFGNPLVENLKKIQNSLELNVDNKTASESKLTASDRTTTLTSNVSSMTNLNTHKTHSVNSYSTSGQDTKKMNQKSNEANPYDSILADIWDTEAKKMINFNQNFYQDNSSNTNQSSSFLMRHNSSSGYFRNSPRNLNSANGYR